MHLINGSFIHISTSGICLGGGQALAHSQICPDTCFRNGLIRTWVHLFISILSLAAFVLFMSELTCCNRDHIESQD